MNMLDEIVSKLSIFWIFWRFCIFNDIVNLLFNIWEFDSKAFIKSINSLIFIIGSNNIDKVSEIFFNIVIINQKSEYLFEVNDSWSKRTANDIKLSNIFLFD